MTPPENARRSGFVTIVGRPNSGKSTFVNFLVGEKVSIVTDKPQTTRKIVRGIVSRPEGQIVLVDTPGIHKPTHRMNEHMMKAARDAMSDADIVTLIADASVPFGRGDEFSLDLIRPVGSPKFLLLNKIDKIQKQELLPLIDRYSKLVAFEEIIPISALTGENVETFVAAVLKLLPEGPAYYPEDQLSDQPERSIAGEMIREKLIVYTRDELPYSTAVIVDQFEEGDALHRIHATIYVERESQKAIVIGKGGQLLKDVGTAARQDLERFFGKKIYLELHVRVKRNWRDDEEVLGRLGLPG